MTDESGLWDIARSLYATAHPDFIGARNEAARELKKSGDMQGAQRVAAFRKPSVSADLVNRLVRESGDLADEIADLGATLRAAQVDADAATLRGLDQERRQLLVKAVAWARAEVERSGNTVTEAVLRDVEQTVWAAIVDEWAAATVQAGLLVRPLSPGGFGEVDVSGASALDVDMPTKSARPVRRRPVKKAPKPAEPTPKGPPAAVQRARKQAVEALERTQASAQEAQHALEEAVGRSEAAEASLGGLEAEHERLRAELAEVTRRLRDSRQEVSDSRAGLRLAEKQRRAAAAEVDRALSKVDPIESS